MSQAIEVAKEPQRVPEGPVQPPWWNMMPMILVGVMFLFLMFRQGRREKQEKQKLQESLRKNDKVLTIGGIYGTVMGLSEPGQLDEVTLKLDENVKIKVTRASILRNLSREEEMKAAKADGQTKDSKQA